MDILEVTNKTNWKYKKHWFRENELIVEEKFLVNYNGNKFYLYTLEDILAFVESKINTFPNTEENIKGIKALKALITRRDECKAIDRHAFFIWKDVLV